MYTHTHRIRIRIEEKNCVSHHVPVHNQASDASCQVLTGLAEGPGAVEGGEVAVRDGQVGRLSNWVPVGSVLDTVDPWG